MEIYVTATFMIVVIIIIVIIIMIVSYMSQIKEADINEPS